MKRFSLFSKTKLNKKKKPVAQVVLLVLGIPFILAIFGVGIYMAMLMQDLPDIGELESGIAQSTIIQDRNGKELYKIYGAENRKYVPLSEISDNFKQAMIAIEDKNFYKHPGIDIMGILRAVVRNVTNIGERSQGASTITQQLVKNLVLKDNTRSYERKLKEAILAYQLEQKYSKDKILELYLNQVPFGSNSHGIEMASLRFFNKQAKDLSVAESAILASLPKGPTYYSPFGQNKHLLLGYCSTDEGTANVGDIGEKETATKKATTFDLTILANERVWIKAVPDGNDSEKYEGILEVGEQIELSGEEEYAITVGNKGFEMYIGENKLKLPKDRYFVLKRSDYADLITESVATESNEAESTIIYKGVGSCTNIEDENYIKGRKDLVLERMYEDGYITKEQMDEAWQQSHEIEFQAYKEEITAPHFVMYVREYLEDKYGEGVSSKGYIVKTTLDNDLQEAAEEIVAEKAKANETKYGISNAALVSVEPGTGQILAMVGSRDYWDAENDGNVNVTTRKRQPGSSFKPLIFAKLFEGNWGAGSVMWDVETKLGTQQPNNYDGKFNGPMRIRSALAYSRNIPAIKAFLLAGGEEPVLDFLDKLGFGYLREFRDNINAERDEENKFYYGWPLAIGTGEVRPLDMANAFATFSTNGVYKTVSPILEIRTSEGELIEEWDAEEGKAEVMDPQVAYQIADILSDYEARPADPYWRNGLAINGQVVAAKTGTSNKRFGEQILPSDLWTVGTSRYVATAVWAGNNDGSALNARATGLGGASPIFKAFMEKAHEGKEKIGFEKPEGITLVNISTLSGDRATKETPEQYARSDIFSGWSVPQEFDTSFKKVTIDTRNGFLATEQCSDAVTEEVLAFLVHSEKPEWSNWENPVQEWARDKGLSDSGITVDPSQTSELCKETAEEDRPTLTIDSPESYGFVSSGKVDVKIDYTAPLGVAKIEYYLDETLQSTKTKPPFELGFVRVPEGPQPHTIKVVLYDINYFTTTAEVVVKQKEDTEGPVISIITPKGSQEVPMGEHLALEAEVYDEASYVEKVEIYKGNNLIKFFTSAPYTYSFYVNPKYYKEGANRFTFKAIDGKGNETSSSVTVDFIKEEE